MQSIRIILPFHLRTLANVTGEVSIEVAAPITQRRVLDALEARYPKLAGTIRDHATGQRRPLLRFFGCREDLSFDTPDAPLPLPIVEGRDPLIILGAVAGG